MRYIVWKIVCVPLLYVHGFYGDNNASLNLGLSARKIVSHLLLRLTISHIYVVSTLDLVDKNSDRSSSLIKILIIIFSFAIIKYKLKCFMKPRKTINGRPL